MQNETPKTTIYLQAIITTDAVPDFSFFNQLSKSNVQVASSESSPLLDNIVAESNPPKPTFSGEREGDPNKPITERQIGFLKKLIEQGKTSLPKIQAAYHVSDLPELTDADVQQIAREAKRR